LGGIVKGNESIAIKVEWMPVPDGVEGEVRVPMAIGEQQWYGGGCLVVKE